MRVKNILQGITTVFILFAMVGCGKPYVGNKVNVNSPMICRVVSFPADCTINEFKDLTPHVTIYKVDDNGNYLIKGYFDASQGQLKSFAHIVRHESEFRMIFISNNVVVDNKNLSLRSIDVNQKLEFEFEYHSDVPIDAVAFTYNLMVRG